MSGGHEFSEFYSRLKEIKDHHRRHPNETIEPMELEFMDGHEAVVDDGTYIVYLINPRAMQLHNGEIISKLYAIANAMQSW
jgi:hypothetical protein